MDDTTRGYLLRVYSALTLALGSKGIGERLKESFSSLGLNWGGGCGGCVETENQLNRMTAAQAISQKQRMLDEMEKNVQSSEKFFVRFGKRLTTAAMRREFCSKELDKAIDGRRRDDEALFDHLTKIMASKDCPTWIGIFATQIVKAYCPDLYLQREDLH